MFKSFKNGLKSKKGQGFVEYALILALVVIVAMVMLGNIGKQTNTAFEKVNTELTNANAGG